MPTLETRIDRLERKSSGRDRRAESTGWRLDHERRLEAAGLILASERVRLTPEDRRLVNAIADDIRETGGLRELGLIQQLSSDGYQKLYDDFEEPSMRGE